MTDKDILISDLNDISEILNNNGYCGWCKAIRKAIAMLKEQEAVVRCKDCKKRNSWECWQYFFGRIKIPDDWFCADGERRDAD